MIDVKAIRRGEIPGIDLVPILLAHGALRPMVLSPGYIGELFGSDKRHRGESYSTSPEQYSGHLITSRLAAYRTHRALVHGVFEDYARGERKFREFGPGATGYLFNHVIESTPFAEDWVQFEVNPNDISANRREAEKLGIKADVRSGNIYKMHEVVEPGSADVVCGLSSWDTQYFMEESMGQVASALKPGGLFIHIQDVAPGHDVCLYREWNRRGRRTPVNAVVSPSVGGGPQVIVIQADGRLVRAHDIMQTSWIALLKAMG